MRSARRVILALATAALLAAPSTAAASSKLFRVWLSGRDTADVTRSFAVPPNSERCTGTITDTRHLTSSFGVKPVRSRAVTPNRSFGWLDFKARITRPRYTARRDTSGDWGIDLGEDPDLYPRQPGECEFTHAHEAPEVPLVAAGEEPRRVVVQAHPGGRQVQHDRRTALQLDARMSAQGEPSADPGGSAEDEAHRGSREAAREWAGESAVSGTIVIPYAYDVDDPDINEHQRGQERLKYTLTVRRVR